MQVPKSTPQISLNVPGVNAPYTREFGKLGNAIAGTGGDILSVGSAGLEQVKHAEAQDASSKAYFQDKIDSENQIIKLKLQSPDGYSHQDPQDPSSPVAQNPDQTPRTITQEFHSWANDRYQQNQQSMPSELASEMYRQKALPYISDQLGLLQSDAQTMKVKSYDQNQASAVRAFGDQLVTNPIVSNFYSHSNDIATNFKSQIGVMHNATDAQAKTQAAYQSMARDLMQGAYTQILAEKKEGDPTRVQAVSQWRDVLSGNDSQSKMRASMGLPTISTMMDPVQKSVEEEKLIRLLPTAKAMDNGDYQHQLHQTITAHELGQGDPGAFQHMVQWTVDRMNSGEIHGGEASKNIGDLMASRAIGKLGGPSFDVLPLQEKMALMDKASTQAKQDSQTVANVAGLSYTGDMGATAVKSIDDRISKRINDAEDAKKKDFAAFTQSALPSGQKASLLDYSSPTSLGKSQNATILQSSLRDSYALSKTNIPNNPEYWRPLTLDQSKTISQTLSDPKINDEQTGNSVKAMAKGYGKWFPQVMDTMIKDGNLPESWRIAALNPTSAGTTAMVSSIRGNKAIDTSFKNFIEASGQKEGDLDQAVGKYTQPWIQAQLQSSPLNLNSTNVTNSVNSAVKNYAKQIITTNPSEGFDTAAQKAYNQLIGNYVHIGTSGAPGMVWGQSNQGNVATPRQIGNRVITDSDNAVIQHNLSNVLMPENLAKLNPIIPTLPNGKQSPFGDEFLPMVQRTGRTSFVSSPEPGYNIWFRDRNGVMTQLQTKNSQGKPVPAFIPIDQAINPPPKSAGILDTIKKYLPGMGQGPVTPTEQRHRD